MAPGDADLRRIDREGEKLNTVNPVFAWRIIPRGADDAR
jgi:hypothetical protein